MGRINFLSLLTILFFSAPEVSLAEYRVKDSQGTEIVLQSTPWRVVTMTPALAELAMAIGLQESNIVGVSEYTSFPSEMKSKPSIGPYSKPSLEKIIGLKPDLILASEDGTSQEIIRRLRKVKIPVMVIKTDSLTSIQEAYPILGKAFGQEVQAKIALQSLHQKSEGLKSRASARKSSPTKKISVMIQVGEDPLVVTGGGNFLNEGLALLGVSNTYADAKSPYPRVSVEDVLKRNPDVILLVALGSETRAFDKAKKRWLNFSTLAAVREKRVYIIQSDALVRPGPRLPDGLIEVESVLFQKEGSLQ